MNARAAFTALVTGTLPGAGVAALYLSAITLVEGRGQALAMEAYARSHGQPYTPVPPLGDEILMGIGPTILFGLMILIFGLLAGALLVLPSAWLSEKLTRWNTGRVLIVTAIGSAAGAWLMPILMYGDRPDLEGGILMARTVRDGAVIGGILAFCCGFALQRLSPAVVPGLASDGHAETGTGDELSAGGLK